MSSEVVKSETLLAPPRVEWRRWTGFDLLSNRPKPVTTKPSGRCASDAVRTVRKGVARRIMYRGLSCATRRRRLLGDRCGLLAVQCVLGRVNRQLRLVAVNELCAFWASVSRPLVLRAPSNSDSYLNQITRPEPRTRSIAGLPRSRVTRIVLLVPPSGKRTVVRLPNHNTASVARRFAVPGRCGTRYRSGCPATSG